MSSINVSVPDGVSGPWSVQTFTVSERESAFTLMRAMRRPLEYVPAGSYKRLVRGGVVVMSNTPMEIQTNRPIIQMATGNVLINGLGLGVVLTAILRKPEVESVTVIEKSEDVIRLVAPSFSDYRVKIVHDDAMTYKPAKDAKFDAVWHDIWDDICADNLPEMKTLSRRYGKKTFWQGCWSRELITRRDYR